MYEFYRQSLIGKALVDTVDEKVSNNLISPKQANFIMEKFDEAIPIVFNRSVSSSMSFKGTIGTYNYVDGVWKFIAKDFVMSINNEYYKTNLIKIVACDAETNTEGPRRRKKKT